jgi:hypothetical protein
MNKNLTEGVDFYYLEKDGTKFKIFTEKYLSERGFCCKNNCKHCPYGFRDKFSDSMDDFKKLIKEQHQILDKYITHYGKKKIFLEDNSTYAWGKNPELTSLFEGALKEIIKDIHVTYKEKDASFFITIELK